MLYFCHLTSLTLLSAFSGFKIYCWKRCFLSLIFCPFSIKVLLIKHKLDRSSRQSMVHRFESSFYSNLCWQSTDLFLFSKQSSHRQARTYSQNGNNTSSMFAFSLEFFDDRKIKRCILMITWAGNIIWLA